MSEASRRASEVAREVAESLREGVALILGGVLVVTLAAVVIGSLGASYDARMKVAFPRQPAAIRSQLSPPVRDLSAAPVTRELERALRSRGEDPGALPDRLLVLQRSDDVAELVASGPSRGSATGLVTNWADRYIAYRSVRLRRTLGRLRRAARARLRRAESRAARERALRRIALIDAVGGRLPDAEVVQGPVLSGYRDLVPWPAPLAGFVLGAVLAIWRGSRRRRLRTAEDARALGPPVLARLRSDTLDGFGPELRLLASKLVVLGGGRVPQTLLVTLLDDSDAPAERLAASLAAGAGLEVRVERWDELGTDGADAWIALLTLGTVESEIAGQRLSALALAGRGPDGLVVLEGESADPTAPPPLASAAA